MKKIILIYFALLWSTAHEAQTPVYTYRPALDLPLLGIGLGGATTGQLLQHKKTPLRLDDIAKLDRMNIPAFDRKAAFNWSPSAAKASDILMITGIAVPSLLLLDKDVRRNFTPIALMGLEVFSVNMALTDFSKWGFHRTRPYVYNPNAPLEPKLERDARFSYFSGHTSATAAMCFFTAKVYNDMHPHSKARPYIWATAVALPLVTGYFRFRAGKHFPTDIITGYLIGAGLGILIPHLHRNNL